MSRVVQEGCGVVVLLGNSLDGQNLLANLQEKLVPANNNVQITYNVVGVGSQILRDLGVRKMRLLSTPARFNALSGFGLEVVEYIPPV